jgi:hypothetical protein
LPRIYPLFDAAAFHDVRAFRHGRAAGAAAPAPLEVETARLAAVERSEAELLQLEQIVNRMEPARTNRTRGAGQAAALPHCGGGKKPHDTEHTLRGFPFDRKLIIGIRVSIMTYDSGFAMIDSQHRAILQRFV